jgi:hypothetical protein
MTGLGFEPRTYGLKAHQYGGTGVHERTLVTRKRVSSHTSLYHWVTLVYNGPGHSGGTIGGDWHGSECVQGLANNGYLVHLY